MMPAADQFYVEIVAYEGDELVKRIGSMTERFAERAERGANINLNHSEYFTRVVPAGKAS